MEPRDLVSMVNECYEQVKLIADKYPEVIVRSYTVQMFNNILAHTKESPKDNPVIQKMDSLEIPKHKEEGPKLVDVVFNLGVIKGALHKELIKREIPLGKLGLGDI